MGTLRVDENEINYGFVNNMDGAKSNIEYANTKINWLFENYCVPTDFTYYNSLIRMKSDLEDEASKIEKFKKDILDFVAYLKEIEAENSELMNSEIMVSLFSPINNNQKSVSKNNLKEYSFSDYEKYMQYLENHQNVNKARLDFYVGSKVSMKNGTRYTENVLGGGISGVIGQTEERPEGDYYVDRVALYQNGKLIANIGEEGTNIDLQIKKYAKKQGCSESEIKTVMHISTGAEHKGATGWVDVSQMTYNDFKKNRTEYYQNVSNESETTTNIQTRKFASGVAKGSISGVTTAVANLAAKKEGTIIATNVLGGIINSAESGMTSKNGRSSEENQSKNNSTKNKYKGGTPDIDLSKLFSILGTHTFSNFSDDFVGPRPSEKMVRIQQLNKLEARLESTKENLQNEIKPYESKLADINEQMEQLEKKRGTSHRQGHEKISEINGEIEVLKAEQEKILNDPSYLKLLQDIATIDYYQTKINDSRILIDYLNDDLELDYNSDYKVNDERLKSMHNKYSINANDSSLYFYEGYEKYNPLLIAQYAYTEAGDNKFEDSVRQRDVMMNGSDIGAQYLKAYAYMTQDQRNMYNYLYDSEGFESAEKFLSALKNTTTWKEQAGAYEAREYIISLDFDVDNSKMTSQDFENLSTDYEVIDGKYVKKDLSNVVLKDEGVKNVVKTFDTGFTDGINGWCDGIKNLFINGKEASDRSIDDYKNAGILGCLSQTKYFSSYKVGQASGNNFIPSMIGLAAGGFSGVARVGRKIGSTLMGTSAAGNSKQEALKKRI